MPSNPCLSVHNSLNFAAKNCVKSKLSLSPFCRRCCRASSSSSSSSSSSFFMPLIVRAHIASSAVADARTPSSSDVSVESIFCKSETSGVFLDWIPERMAVVAEEEEEEEARCCAASDDNDDRGRERPLSSEDTARNTKAWRRFWSSSSASFIPVSALIPKTNFSMDVREFGEEGVFEEDAFFMVVQVSSSTTPTTMIWYTRKRANAAGRYGGQKICSALLLLLFSLLPRDLTRTSRFRRLGRLFCNRSNVSRFSYARRR